MSEHISVSQLTTWLRCPKQYEFRYLEEIKLPPRSALTRGSAGHKAWEADHWHKLQTKENLPLETVLDVYSSDFDTRAVGTEWQPDEDAGKIKDVGVRMVTIYHENVSKKIQPIAVEQPFEVEMDGHIVQGVIDLETDKGEIRDAKTAGKKKADIPVDYQLQLSIYARAKPNAKKFILDTAIATEKKTEIETLTMTRADLPLRRLGNYLQAFGEALIRGYYPPTNPGNWCCSEKWCGYWNMCPFGGKK